MLKEILCRVKSVTLLIFICHGFQVLASLDCDFEDGLCDWQNSGDFDWQLQSFNTRSDDTGPSSDHTTGNYGHYIYIEASGKDEGDKAILSSPVQEPGPYCLTFWYNMYGINIGALNVYMKLTGGSETLILRKDKNLGNNDWRKAVINNDANETYQIVLEGVRGNGSKGDIAVDDISMKHGRCFIDLASIDCNFEDGLCNWQQWSSDDFDWLRESGDTESDDTGPSFDHTTEGDGHYIYIKASGQGKGDKAIISSPVQESGPYCLTFWYNMYGNDIGALNVYMILRNGNKTPLFTKGENHGHNDWRKAVVNNKAKDTYRIVFEGVRGDGWEGDIAIDDISMIHGQCFIDLTSLDCNFEDGLCNWQQNNSDDFDWLRESGDTQSYGTGPSSDHTTGDCGNRTIHNGIFIAPEGTTFGKTGTHVCNIGYFLVGDTSIICTVSGWNSTDASCTLVDCGKRSIRNGTFFASEGTTYGKTATQVCNKGFNLIGDTAVICTSIGWNGTVATCNIIGILLTLNSII